MWLRCPFSNFAEVIFPPRDSPKIICHGHVHPYAFLSASYFYVPRSTQRDFSTENFHIFLMSNEQDNSAGKRKASSALLEDRPSPPKQAKVIEGQPTNKVLPTTINFPPRTPGTLRLATWNICGLAASQKKVSGIKLADFGSPHIQRTAHQGFKFYVEAEDPDILVLTETKVCCAMSCCSIIVTPYLVQVNNVPVDLALNARFPYSYWSISNKKTYCE
jgi:hypothetical protein